MVALVSLFAPATSHAVKPAPPDAVNFVLTSGPGASSWGNGRLDVFARGSDNALWHRSHDITGWGKWESLGGAITSDPAAVSWGNGRIDVFAKGTDNALYHRAFTSQGWHPWEHLGGVLSSGPAVASWESGRLDVFARGADNALYHRAFTSQGWPQGWHAWEYLGGNLTGDPAAVSWGPNRIDIFAPGPRIFCPGQPCPTTDVLNQIAWTGSGWSPWVSRGGELTSSAGVASLGAGHLDVFARGAGNDLVHTWFNGTSWSPWESLGGGISTSPDAAAWPGRIDVFAGGTDQTLYSRSLINSSWQPWQNLDGLPLPSQHVFATTTSSYVDIRNDEAVWRVYTKCSDGVGPGYVARVVMNSGSLSVDQPGRTVVDDPWGYQGPVPMGLGKFVFRHARAAYNETLKVVPPGKNTWDDNGRVCGTVGVDDSLSGPINGTPSYNSGNDIASLDEIVHFRDEYNPAGSSLLTVTYKWRFYAHYLKMWAVVSPRCHGDACPLGSPRAWIKGPKFVAGINGHPDADGYTQITTYNASPFPIGTGVCANRSGWPGAPGDAGPCPSRSAPDVGLDRVRVQFNYAEPPSFGRAPEVQPARCSDGPLRRCFNAIFRAYVPSGSDQSPDITPGNPAGFWASENPEYWGLHSWSIDATDPWPFQGTAPCPRGGGDTYNPTAEQMWEQPGVKPDHLPDNYPYDQAGGFFFGWRDCINVHDAPRLYRLIDGPIRGYGTYASFSFNTPGSNYFAETLPG